MKSRSTLFRSLGLLAIWISAALPAMTAADSVGPVPPPPDRPGIPPRTFPPDREKPLALPYRPTPDKVAVMVVTAHPDDEGMLVAVVPHIARARKLPMAFVVLTSGENGKVNGDRSIRENEMRRACWIYGLPNEPIFGRFRDGGSKTTLEDSWKLWGGENEAAAYLVEKIRRYRPEVIVTLAFDGMTGHTNHVAAALSATKAAAGAADAVAFPVPPGGAPVWSPKKIYVHNWPVRPMTMDWTKPMEDFGGKTPHDFASAGLRMHVTQGMDRRPMLLGRNSTKFGLYFTSVGSDSGSPDLFDNLDLGAYAPFTQLPGPDFSRP